ncbi:hypothetical protein BGZ83_006127 [Gryganskiella cystojenkinii]|nr:hypothetical protein BGZ83_006127 [Gryganskiella cystojenkinii]
MPPKSTPRVKGNVRAANSSRAAELASTSTTGSSLSMASLGGFAQFATPAFTPSSSYVASSAPRSATPNRSGSPSSPNTSSSSTFGGLDLDTVSVIRNGELSMIIKRLMSKRDTTTKVRALEDLEKWVKAQPEDDEAGSAACHEAIGPWIKLYIKLTTDVDRRVRLMTNNVHFLLVKRVKKRLAPYLKEVVAAWIGTFFDPTRDVARVATEAFKTPETLSDPRFNTKEEMDTRYGRVASSALYTLGYVIDTLSAEALQKGAQEITPLLDNIKLWELFGHTNPLVRRASYSILKTITTKAPELIQDRLAIISKHFFPSAFADKDTTTHSDLWDALLVFTKSFPQSWTLVADKKPTMNLFFSFLKSAGHGSVTVTYRSILPLISTWCDDSVLGKNGTGFPFVKDFFDNFWKGFENANIDKETGSTALFLEAYLECLVFFISFLTSVEDGKVSAKFSEDEQGVAKKITVHLIRLLNIPSVRERALSGLWTPVVELMCEIMSKDPSEANVKSGKRAIVLLSQISSAAQEKQDSAVIDLTEKAADQLVQIVARQCSETQSIGPSQLLSSLALQFEVAVFSNPASQTAMHNFFDRQFADMLLTSEVQGTVDTGSKEGNESLPHLLDLFSGYLGNTQQQDHASTIWKRVMEKVLAESESDVDLERQRVILQGLLYRTSLSTPAFDLKLDAVNDFLTSIVVNLQYRGSPSGEALLADALCSTCMVPDSLKLEIVDSLSTRLELFVSDVIGGQALGKKEEAESILEIVQRSLSSIVPLSIDSDAEGPLRQIVVLSFDLSCQSDEHLGSEGQKVVDKMQVLSQDSEDTRFLLKECLTEHIQDCIKNMQRFTSPEDLVSQAQKLADLLELTDASDRFELLSAFFFEKEHWLAMYQTLIKSGPHPSMAMVDPIVEASLCQGKRLEVDIKISERYDSFGLSAYGRLALFTLELLKQEGEMVPLFLQYPEKMTWIMDELLKVRQGCLDAFQTPSSNVGVFYSPNLHADANDVVFRTLLRDLTSMATSWVTLVLEDDWESKIIEALSIKASGSTQVVDDDGDDDGGCSPVFFAKAALADQDGIQERVFSELVSVLALSDTDENDFAVANAKSWCQLLKSEYVPLSLAAGMIRSLKKRLANTGEFANLVNYWASELSAARPHEVSFKNTSTVRRLTLLVAALEFSSSDEPSLVTIPQHRAMNLLQSIRRWISDSETLQTFDDQDGLLVHSLLLQLLGSLANQVQELPGAHWEMMFGYITSVLSGLGESSLAALEIVVLERACALTTHLVYLAEEEEDIMTVWEDHNETILVSAMRILGRDDTSLQKMDRPVRRYLESLAKVCEHIPDRLLLSHGSVAEQCRLLKEPLTDLQMLAYKQLHTILIEQVQELSVQMEIKAPASPALDQENESTEDISRSVELDDKMTTPKFPASLWAIISNPPRGFPAMDVNVDADDEMDLKEEFSLLALHHGHDEDEEEYGIGGGVAAKTEKAVSHAVLGYLLAWKLAFVVFENTTYTVKSLLVEQLRTSSTMNDFLPYLFHLLGINAASSLLNSNDSSNNSNQALSSGSDSAAPMEPFDLSRWDITDYQITGFDLSSPEIGFPLLAGHLYYTCLGNVPSLVRIWWTECKLRQLSIAVESLTERYFSPLLIARELTSLAKAQQKAAQGSQAAAAAALSGVTDELKELQIKTSKATSEVMASFQIDEATMEIAIRLPSNFPLRQVEVEGLQRVGVKEARWRAWLLAVAGVIAAQNGSLIDALTLFRRNVGLHFEGVEDCTICYSIVSVQDRSLPNKTCKTCKHRFHASCLYKWFRTSNSSSCPLCRTLW